jgi:hypothetical protein
MTEIRRLFKRIFLANEISKTANKQKARAIARTAFGIEGERESGRLFLPLKA